MKECTVASSINDPGYTDEKYYLQLWVRFFQRHVILHLVVSSKNFSTILMNFEVHTAFLSNPELFLLTKIPLKFSGSSFKLVLFRTTKVLVHFSPFFPRSFSQGTLEFKRHLWVPHPFC